MNTLSSLLGEFAAGVDADRLPPSTTRAVTTCLIDTIGCLLAGRGTPVAGAAARAAGEIAAGARGRSTVFASGTTMPPAQAALANATAAHALELDDTDAASFCHTGAVIVPTILAQAEDLASCSGADLVAAVVVGYETTVRLARWMNPDHRLAGFHTTATIPTLGAAAAVSRLRGGDADAIANAIAVATAFVGGTFEFLAAGTNLKRVHAGKAAYCGTTAAILAGAGVEGPPDALEGSMGLFATMAARPVREFDASELGITFAVEQVGRKLYPCCRFCHSSIDAAVALHRLGTSAGEITGLTVTVSRLCADQTGNAYPGNELQRQFSTPYGVALGVLNGAVTVRDYSGTPDSQALELASRVQVVVDEDLPVSDRRAVVAVDWADGTRQEVAVDMPRGEPSNPVSDRDIEEKFVTLVSAEQSIDVNVSLAAVRALPTSHDVVAVMRQLRLAASGS